MVLELLAFSIRRIQMFGFGWNAHFDTDLSSPAMLHNLVGFVFLKAFPTVSSPFKLIIVGDPGTTGTCGFSLLGH
jgi:hypothetical protein